LPERLDTLDAMDVSEPEPELEQLGARA